MKYCHKCGANLKEGDSFCTSCGTKQNDEANNNQSNLNEKISNTFKQEKLLAFKDVCLSMILKPVTGIKEFIEKGGKSLTIALTVFIVLMQGFLGIWKTNQVFSTFGKVIIELVKKINSLDGLFNGYSKSAISNSDIMNMQNQMENFKNLIEIPYLKIFFQNACTIGVITILIFAITYLVLNIILKKKIEAFKIYKLSIGTAFPIINFQIISTLCSYMSFLLGASVMLIGIIVSIVCFSIVIKETFDVNENNVVFFVSVSFMIIVAISMILTQKFVLSNINDLIFSTAKLNF